MAKSKTPTFILELALETSAHDEAELNARFEAARQLYNACLDEALRRLNLLRQSKGFQKARKMPKTANGKRNKERTEAFKELNSKFDFSEYAIIIYATTIRRSWINNHIDSNTAQKLASRAFKAAQKVAFGQAKRVRFKGKNQLKSVEGSTNKTGIRYKEKTGYVEKDEKMLAKPSSFGFAYVFWKGLKLKAIINPNDAVVVHGLSHRVKFCRIVKRIFNGKVHFFVQLALEGEPLQKFKAPDKIVGLDIGPSTIAVVSDKQASLERFCDELKDKQKEIRLLQRKSERQRRANNPQNYNPNGTIKEGKKTWHSSTRYKKTKTKLANIQRKLAAHRKSLHGNLANRILKLGKNIKTEKLSYRAFQKNYGKSVKNRAPGMFMEIIRRKAENAGGSVVEFSTKTTKLSQYCHKCGKYTKKNLSQRVHTCCNLNIQRDVYSAFLAGSISSVENHAVGKACCLDTADVLKRWRSIEAILRQAVSSSTQVANGRHRPSSFGMVNPKAVGESCVTETALASQTPRELSALQVDPIRDRAARLRSSDVQHHKGDGTPDAKNRDVVALQLWLF